MNKSLIALVLTAVLAGCSSGGTSEPAQPQFDGDYGFENIDPGFGQDDTDNDGGYENADPEYGVDAPSLKDKIAQADLGFVHIPELGDIPFFNKDTDEAHIGAVKERSSEEETLYGIYVDDKRVGEIIIRDSHVTITAGDKEISGEKETYKDTNLTFWTVRDTDGNVVGDFKRLDDGVWVFREEISRETFVVKYHDGQWNFIPVADIKNKVKDNLPSQAEVTKVRAKMQVNKLRTLK
ncbi:membrane lipoprotein lipid attachment site-containing protein [Vibrio sp. J383]|uniref:membrane lipoprotein lipid attachment site-containing protein n=1 Tax=Vibrio sp. J383 TaxID=2942997 RepID=UPI0020BF67D7|nr:membrane lipoprotein lipid attachment site-containing protein [Vibrio sp. J383]UQV20080.1 membrane lipoprotein lipid attachment site-containing protein [Vibrio sp. J383]